MPSMEINVEGTGGRYADVLKSGRVVQLNQAIPIRVETLDRGMVSGEPSIAFIIELPEVGIVVLAQTSLRLFQMCAALTTAKYGDLVGAAEAKV